MKLDMVIAGVGGQGILSTGSILAVAAIEHGLNVKTVETRGMAQRGGRVYMHVRISDIPVHSALIPMGHAHCLLAMHPEEGGTHLLYLRGDGCVIVNTELPPDMMHHGDLAAALAHYNGMARTEVPAMTHARASGSPRSANLVMLGAASRTTSIPSACFEIALQQRFGAKGDAVLASCYKAFHTGRELGAPQAKRLNGGDLT